MGSCLSTPATPKPGGRTLVTQNSSNRADVPPQSRPSAISKSKSSPFDGRGRTLSTNEPTVSSPPTDESPREAAARAAEVYYYVN